MRRVRFSCGPSHFTFRASTTPTRSKNTSTEEDPWAPEMDGGQYRWLRRLSLAGAAPRRGRPVRRQRKLFRREAATTTGSSIRAVPSAASRATLLKSGQVQWVDRAPIEQVLDFQADENVKVEQHHRARYCLYPHEPEVRAVRRRAGPPSLQLCDRQGQDQSGHFPWYRHPGRIGRSSLHLGFGRQLSSTINYDPDKAKALLAEAGCCRRTGRDHLFRSLVVARSHGHPGFRPAQGCRRHRHPGASHWFRHAQPRFAQGNDHAVLHLGGRSDRARSGLHHVSSGPLRRAFPTARPTTMRGSTS